MRVFPAALRETLRELVTDWRCKKVQYSNDFKKVITAVKRGLIKNTRKTTFFHFGAPSEILTFL